MLSKKHYRNENLKHKRFEDQHFVVYNDKTGAGKQI